MKASEATIPKKGLAKNAVLKMMRDYGVEDVDYRSGRTFSLVYYLGEEHTQFLKDAHNLYFSENGLNPMAFLSLKRFEAEVIRMTAHLLRGDRNVVGAMTSGGTESCLLAVKTYRDLARAKRPWIRRPEMIAPASVHVAFEKGAHYFGVKMVHAPLDKDFRVDVKAVRKLINRNTILLIGSAPPYPHGVVDPIEELGRLALQKKLPLHVDACLGGFFLPWVERLGRPVPRWDYRVPGVTSISADVHKYGYAAKGASTITYRNMDYMKHQIFVYESWPGGVYAGPGLLGTRPGGSIAAAWATLMAMGEDGYLAHAEGILATRDKLIAGINAIEGLQVNGQPDIGVFSYRSTDKKLNIFAVGDEMEKRGWHPDRNQRPDSLHAMITPSHQEVADRFLADLREAVAHVRRHPELADQGGAATYGLISAVPLRGMVKKQVLKMMMDFYGPEGKAPEMGAKDDDLATRLGQFYVKTRRDVEERLGRIKKKR